MISNNTGNYGAKFRRDLAEMLPKPDNAGKTGNLLGTNLDKAEEAYFNAAVGKDTGATVQAEINYQRALRAYQSFSQLMRNSFQIMMEGIRGLNVR